MKDFDLKAGKQIFLGEGDRPNTTLTVPKDTTNPIDIRLRQLAMIGEPVSLKDEFLERWVAVERQGTIYTGRIKDFLRDGSLRIKTPKGVDIVCGREDVIEFSDREI